jgi:hypothetical protein
MAQCPKCSLENNPTSPYCARCGTFLQREISTLYEDGALDYTILSSHNTPALPALTPTSQNSAPVTPTPMMSTPQPFAPITQPPILPISQKQVLSQPQPRTFIHTLFSIIFYLLGALSFAFGVFIILMPFLNNARNALLFISLLLVSTVILIIMLIRHKTPRLRLRHLFLLVPGTTICGFIVLIGAAGILSLMHSTTMLAEYPVFGFIVALYGLIVAVIVLR